jgi:hypothetical protein
MATKNVETNFNPETGFFLLQLRKEDVGVGDAPVDFQGKTFMPKEEVHITVIGSNPGQQLAAAMAEDDALVGKMRAAVADYNWAYELKDEWYHVLREDEAGPAESIIRMARVPQLEPFYRRVEVLAAVHIPPRPAHVTLYTWNDPDGIGLATWQEFERRVTGPVAPQLWRQTGEAG